MLRVNNGLIISSFMVNSFFLSDQSDALLRFLPMDAPQRNDLKGLAFILATSGQAMVEVDSRPMTLLTGCIADNFML